MNVSYVLFCQPIRLTVLDANRVLEEDDYLRIHHTPRRFTVTSDHDWGRNIDADGVGVIVARDDDLGYIVIDKPAGVPVHSTVDNTLENVSAAIGRSLLAQKMRDMKNKQSTQDPSNDSMGECERIVKTMYVCFCNLLTECALFALEKRRVESSKFGSKER
jgi:hypothetical protein